MWLARNKKFGELGVNENYTDEETLDAQNGKEEVEKAKKKPNVFAMLFGKKNSSGERSLDGMDGQIPPKEPPYSEKFTYFKKTPRQEKAERRRTVADAPKMPVVLFLVCMCLSLAGAFVINSNIVYEASAKVQYIVRLCVSMGAYFVPTLLYMLFSKNRSLYNFRRCSLKFAPLTLLFLGLVLCSSALQKYLIAYVFSYRVPVGNQSDSLVWAIVLGALVPAICEEMLVRGVLLNEFSKYAGGFGGVLLSSLLFTLLHFDLQYFGIYFVAGLFLGTLTHVTRSVFPAMIVHFLNNTLSICLSDTLTFVAMERIGGTLMIIVIAAVFFILLGLALQTMERISMKRAVHYLKKDDNENDGQNGTYKNGKASDVVLFTAQGGNTATKTLRLVFNRYTAAAYLIFAAAVILSMVL